MSMGIDRDWQEMVGMFQDESDRVRRLTYRFIGLSIGNRSERTGLCVVEQPPAVKDGQARLVRWL
jgi:hypothetical protein